MCKKLTIFAVVLTILVGMLITPVQSTAGDSKAIAVDPMNSDEGYSAVLYDNTNGLPTSEANAIAETSEGFIWIGSYSGLIRYDGNNFERMDSTSGITSVVSLFVDSCDRLWIGTNDNGVAVMKNGKVTHFSKKNGLRTASVRAIREDKNGKVYLATTQGVGVVDKKMNLSMIHYPKLDKEYIRDLQLGADGVIYGITMTNDIFTIEDGEVTSLRNMVDDGLGNVVCITPDPENAGYLYVGTDESEIYYGKWKNGLEKTKKVGVAPLTYVKEIRLIDGKIYVCADNGIAAVAEGRTKLFSNVPMNNSVDHMMVDYEGNLWFTSSRQGVMKIVPNQFVDVFEQCHLPAAVVNTTCRYEGALFIGQDNGLSILKGNKLVKDFPVRRIVTAGGKVVANNVNLVEVMKGIRIRSIIQDSQQRLWFSTYGEYGLMRYDRGEVYCFTMEDGMPSDRMRMVHECKDRSMLVACTGGAVVIRGEQIKRVYGAEDGVKNTEILTATQAENGDLILGSDGDGLYIITKKGVRHVTTDSGLSSDVVMRVKKDVDRELYWLVTSNSIAYMDADYNVTNIKKFPYSNNFDLYENSREDIWILSSNGIYVCTAKELLKNKEIKPLFYNRENGVPCIATANSYSDITEDGNLYMAGTTGVARVNIEKSFETVGKVKMAVPYVEADGKRIFADENGKIIVPAKVRKMTVYGFVYTYSLLNPKVTYYLKGFSNETSTVARHELKPIDYTNLKGGSYQFVMRLKDSMGRGNKELAVTIIKEKRLQEMLWYRAASLLGLMFLIIILVQYYFHRKTKALRKKEEENKLLIHEMAEAFARTVDMKDKYTNGHSTRVAEYTELLAKELGYDDETIEKYYYIALLHDIGKIAVPSAVLNKNGKLTDEEFAIIKSHSAKGYQALKDISIMPELAIGAGAHHERPDGKGYPKGLKGDEIPRVAQIIAVADTFDAMYSDRPYRKRMNFEKAVSIIKEAAGTQLQEDVVEAFLKLVGEGHFRAPDDDGGGTTEDINNIHKKQQEC